MELGLEKCAMLVMENGKQRMTDGVKLPNQVIRTLGEKETYKYKENIKRLSQKSQKITRDKTL